MKTGTYFLTLHRSTKGLSVFKYTTQKVVYMYDTNNCCDEMMMERRDSSRLEKRKEEEEKKKKGEVGGRKNRKVTD